MRYHKVRIACFSCLLPDEIVTSAEIERRLQPLYERLRLPVGLLELMTGIRERRLWKAGMRPSEVSAMVAEKALLAAGVLRERIDGLFHCSVSRDFVEPATSTVVHHLLRLSHRALNFDISNACLGVLSGMVMMANMIELGQAQIGLVVAGENSRPLLENTIRELNQRTDLTRQEIKSWFASLTIGSAGAAVILAHEDALDLPYRLLGGAHLCNTSQSHLCQGDADAGMGNGAAPLMQTDAEELLKQGVALARETWAETKRELGWDNDSPDVICTHQVGSRHSALLFEALGLSRSRDFSTVDHMGNCGSASLPATAAMALEAGRLAPGGKMALLGIGSGINSLILGIERTA